MFLLSFYNSDTQPRSINQNGFTQAELTNYEIHLDPRRVGRRLARVLHVRREGQRGHAPAARQRLRALPRGSRRLPGDVRAVLPDAAPADPEGSARTRRARPRHPLSGSDRPRDRTPPWIARCRPTWPRAKSTFIQFYQKYTVFSWPWAWRRTAAVRFARRAGRHFVRRSRMGCSSRMSGRRSVVSLACSASNLVLVGAGPVLAAFFRHAAGRARDGARADRRSHRDSRIMALAAIADDVARRIPRSPHGRARMRARDRRSMPVARTSTSCCGRCSRSAVTC